MTFNKIATLVLFITLSSSVFAQGDAPIIGSKLHFGLELEPSIAWLKVNDPLPPALDGDGSKIGFGFGLMTEFAFSKNYSFATGIEVAYRGGKLKSLDTVASVINLISSNYKLEYIEIPLTLKMKTNEIGYFTYFGQFGLDLGLNISSKGDIQTQSSTIDSLGRISPVITTNANGIDVKSGINSLNLSLIIAVGLEYSLGGSTTALAGITFNNGFLNVLDATASNGAKEKAISNTLGLTFGILF